MDLTSDLKCVNCGKVMIVGGMHVSGIGISNYRHCECGLCSILFTKSPGYEYGLYTHEEGFDPDAKARMLGQTIKDIQGCEYPQCLNGKTPGSSTCEFCSWDVRMK